MLLPRGRVKFGQLPAYPSGSADEHPGAQRQPGDLLGQRERPPLRGLVVGGVLGHVEPQPVHVGPQRVGLAAFAPRG